MRAGRVDLRVEGWRVGVSEDCLFVCVKRERVLLTKPRLVSILLIAATKSHL